MKGCLGCLARTVIVILLLGIIGIIAAYFFWMPELDRTLEDSIRRQFILAPSTTVVVSRGSMLDTLDGEVERIFVEADEAKVDGLTVSEFRLLAEGVQIDIFRTALSQKAEFKELTHGEISFVVTEESLLDRWSADLGRKGFSDVELELGEMVRIGAKYDLLVAKVNVEVTGWFSAGDDNRVKFTADKIGVEGTEIGFEKVKASVTNLAPVIDLGRLKLDLRVDQIETDDGELRITARTRSLEDKMDEVRSSKVKLELEEATHEASDEDLLDQIRSLLDFNEEERRQQLEGVRQQLSERGIRTGEQLNEFWGRQKELLADQYQSVLRDLNQLIESQLDDDEQSTGSEDSDEGKQSEEPGTGEKQ